MSITKFRGEYNFMSNFYNADFEFDGNIWNTVEAAYQASKTSDWNDKLKILQMDSVRAKRYGRRVKMQDGFEDHKDEVMRVIVACKFVDNPDLMDKLLATGDEKLIEGNTWHDNYWGICTCGRSSCGVGKNKLGRILMQIRSFKREHPEFLDILTRMGKDGTYTNLLNG